MLPSTAAHTLHEATLRTPLATDPEQLALRTQAHGRHHESVPYSPPASLGDIPPPQSSATVRTPTGRADPLITPQATKASARPVDKMADTPVDTPASHHAAAAPQMLSSAKRRGKKALSPSATPCAATVQASATASPTESEPRSAAMHEATAASGDTMQQDAPPENTAAAALAAAMHTMTLANQALFAQLIQQGNAAWQAVSAAAVHRAAHATEQAGHSEREENAGHHTATAPHAARAGATDDVAGAAPHPGACAETAGFNENAAAVEWMRQLADYQRAMQHIVQQAMMQWASALLDPQQAAGASPAAAADGPPSTDKRFAAPEWQVFPLFDLIRQQYEWVTQWILGWIASVPMPPEEREKVVFFVRQLLNALAPSNFLWSNPEALKLAHETQGESLRAGWRNLNIDLSRGHIAQTDTSQFEVGRNLATTPGAVVFRNDLIELLQYSPTTDQVYERPLLFVPPCVNRYYLMDLQPANSMVRHFVAQGYTVFLISWRSIPPALGHLRWDDYVESGVLAAMQALRTITRQPKCNVLGFCVGGVLLSTALAVLKARGLDWVESFTLMASLIDHGDPGEIRYFISPQLIAAREAQIAEQGGGVVQGRDLATAFSMLRSNDLIWNYVVNNYLKGKTPQAFDLLYWNGDVANLSMPMHTFFLREMYQHNRLREPSGITLCNVPVDVGQYDWPVYIFAAREDHIVPWHAAYQSTQLLGRALGAARGEIRFVLGASGHIAGAINPVSSNRRNYWVNPQLSSDPEAWLEAAESRPGSWWQDWDAWLAPRSGPRIAPPAAPGSAEFPPLEAAPGSYVRMR